MEAMTQEFMLHRRPHVEIWSAREGSDDDNDSFQRQPWTLKGFISETKSLIDPKPTKMLLQQQTVDSITITNNKEPIQKPKSDGSSITTQSTSNHGNTNAPPQKNLMGHN